MDKQSAPGRSISTAGWLSLALAAAAFLWAYWSTLAGMAGRWWNDAQYSHGFLVPVFALWLLWWRRDRLDASALAPSWWGIALILLGVSLRLPGAFFFIGWLDALSILPCLAGLCVLFGGWPALRWAWPAIAFLFFMMPLPYGIETALAYPLRVLATETSTYALQTIGFPAFAEGTDIYLNANRLQVAPACSGMGMLLVFFALSTAIVLVIERSWVDKLVIVLSALPIAILANIWRIFVTAVLFQVASAEFARKVFHGWAGFLMMPVALLLLWIELKLFDRLLIPDESKRSLTFDWKKNQPSRRGHRLQEEG